MRFRLLDLTIGITIVSMAILISIHLLPPLHPTVAFIVHVTVGLVCYVVVSSVLYRRLHLFPLLLPRCPNCHDSNRHFHCLSQKWPTEQIRCAICQSVIELCVDPASSGSLESNGLRFQLLWPYSFGGRWRRLQ
ncbi:MAG TPA: hypothetical protein VGJ26_06760 [Pirellulales bacterium]|jgi:hypothetical protein